MIHEVILPKQGLQMTEGYITKWHKSEGDFVNEGDILFEMETDKAIVPVLSKFSGPLTKILCKEDESYPVATVVAYIGQGERVFISPRAETLAKENNIPLNTIIPSGPDKLVIERDLRPLIPSTKKSFDIVLRLSYSGLDKILKIQENKDPNSVIKKCLFASLKKRDLNLLVDDFTIVNLMDTKIVSLSTSKIPSIILGTKDESNIGFVSFSFDVSDNEDKFIDFVKAFSDVFEDPILAYIK